MAFYPVGPVLTTAGGTLTGPLTVPGITDTAALSVATTTTATGIISANGGTKTSGSAPVITPANTNGVAAQLADTTRDYMVYLTVGTAGTALTVLIGPTASPANTICTASTATAGEAISFRLPAGWFWEWAATTATLAEQFAVGC